MSILKFDNEPSYLMNSDVGVAFIQDQNRLTFNLNTTQNPFNVYQIGRSFKHFSGKVSPLTEILQNEEKEMKMFLLEEFESTLPLLLGLPKLNELYFTHEGVNYSDPIMTFMKITGTMTNSRVNKIMGSSYSFDVSVEGLILSQYNENYPIGQDFYLTLAEFDFKDGDEHMDIDIIGEAAIVENLRKTGNLNPVIRAINRKDESLLKRIFPNIDDPEKLNRQKEMLEKQVARYERDLQKGKKVVSLFN